MSFTLTEVLVRRLFLFVVCVTVPIVPTFGAGADPRAVAGGAVPAGHAASRPADESPAWPPTPPQDRGLPYTRSARAAGLAKLGRTLAAFAGSRYGYVDGLKVRLDDAHLRDGEAVLRDGVVYVPPAFAALVGAGEVDHDVPPDGLDDRWVYTVPRPPAGADAGVAAIDVGGRHLVSLADVAARRGVRVYTSPRGLVVVGQALPRFDADESLDTVITLFDTPEKFADPAIATRYLPALARQGDYWGHVHITPEQRATLAGPETAWPTAPPESFDFTGFDSARLGSQPPAPGVYPRVLFSPQDVPAIAARLQASRAGQMSLMTVRFLLGRSWWDPSTSDGRTFAKLAAGDTGDLHFDAAADGSPNGVPGVFSGQKPGIQNSHVQYVPECLTTMALYCLLTGDDAHGRQAAAAIANYYKLREPLLDEANAISDSEYSGDYRRPDGTVVPMHGSGAQTHWRTVAGVVGHMNLGLSLDFAGKWMTADQIEGMRRVIAKATYGRRAYGQDGPVRFRDINWVAWDLTNYLAVCAIEGMPGFDREAYESNAETVRAFCDWGIDDHGVIYESNGKTPGGLQFELLSMVALARRGDNLFGHPHFRKLLQGQVQMTSPSGNVVVNSGTQYNPFSQAWFSPQFTDEYKGFFPKERAADFLLSREHLRGPSDDTSRQWLFDGFDAEAFGKTLAKWTRVRMPSPTYPGFVHSLLYDADFEPTTRADLALPLDFDDPTHGIFSAYSDRTTDAAWINLMVRPDHYLGAGHHHADAGMIHFSAMGVDWLTQSPFSQVYDGNYYNLVQIDGRSEAQSMPGFALGYQAPATYLGASTSDVGAFASADLSNSYRYRWLTQPGQTWPAQVEAMKWELDPSPANLAKFAGTDRYKMRPWWSFYTYSNYAATSRAEFNPVEYVFRTAGLVRGPHAYGVVADDVKKDGQPHEYEWYGMLNGGVWRANVSGLSAGQIALAFRADGAAATATPPTTRSAPPHFGTDAVLAIEPSDGEPLLLVCTLGSPNEASDTLRVSREPGPTDPKTGLVPAHDRLTITRRGTDAKFRVLLLPVRAGEPMPRVSYDEATATADVAWPDQHDRIACTREAGGPARIAVSRPDQAVAPAK